MADPRQLAENYQKLVCAFMSYFDLLADRGFAPVDMWRTLSRDMASYAEIFKDLIAMMENTTDACSAVKDFDPRTVEWMTNEILEMAEQVKSEQVNHSYAANFIRDIEKSHVFTEMFTAFRVGDPVHMNRIVHANKTILSHKALLLEINIPKEEPVLGPSKSSVKPVTTLKKFSLLAGIRAELRQFIELPPPVFVGDVTIEECLKIRRSAKRFASGPVMLEKVSQLLFAVQGITDPRGYRTAPSAKTAYPLEIIVIATRVHGLSSGAYTYDCFEHRVQRFASGAMNVELAEACYGQEWVKNAPLLLAITAYVSMTQAMSMEQALTSGLIEAGQASQNVLLQACALRMNAVYVGDFDADEVRRILHLKPSQRPIGLICCGMRPRDYAG